MTKSAGIPEPKVFPVFVYGGILSFHQGYFPAAAATPGRKIACDRRSGWGKVGTRAIKQKYLFTGGKSHGWL
jgi:hypothetical protein